MPRFTVLENGKPANEFGFPQLKGNGWRFAWFNSFEAALKHANKWLGEYKGVVLELNKPVDYSGYGDMIEIRQIGVDKNDLSNGTEFKVAELKDACIFIIRNETTSITCPANYNELELIIQKLQEVRFRIIPIQIRNRVNGRFETASEMKERIRTKYGNKEDI